MLQHNRTQNGLKMKRRVLKNKNKSSRSPFLDPNLQLLSPPLMQIKQLFCCFRRLSSFNLSSFGSRPEESRGKIQTLLTLPPFKTDKLLWPWFILSRLCYLSSKYFQRSAFSRDKTWIREESIFMRTLMDCSI